MCRIAFIVQPGRRILPAFAAFSFVTRSRTGLNDVHEIPRYWCLELYFGPESEDHGAMRTAADIRVVLNDGLKKQLGTDVE